MEPAARRHPSNFIQTYYIPWQEVVPENPPASQSTHPLRLSVQFDKSEARAGEQLIHRVRTERVGFRGYRMMLAEIGLPPGTDVDRASLESAIKEENRDLYKYEVLPDRLIVYVWPRAGGSRFDFKFRVRYGFNAQTPPSTLYDYYNPDAQVTVKTRALCSATGWNGSLKPDAVRDLL